MFASSGGAVTALALITAYPGDITALVAHEPPLLTLLPDAEAADRAQVAAQEAYEAGGRGPGMATFIGMTMWRGEFNDEYFSRPDPDPTRFGMPAADDGSRDDPLLSGHSWAITRYRPDFEALATSATRLVIAVGEESAGTVTDRTSRALAERLAREPAVFPSHHGGFVGGEGGFAGQPEAFARRLREVLDQGGPR